MEKISITILRDYRLIKPLWNINSHPNQMLLILNVPFIWSLASSGSFISDM